MPVSPATVREAFVHEEPVVHEDRPAPAAEEGGEARPRTPSAQRALLAVACVAAFLVGFAAVTLLTTIAPAPAPVPRPDNARAPAPSTSSPPATTSPPTTTPATTTP